MEKLTVRQAQSSDRNELAKMRAMLWPETSVEEHGIELELMLSTGMNGTLPASILVAQDDDGALPDGVLPDGVLIDGVLIGFLEAGLRSHVDGCDTAQPVGFVEGWFVREGFRKRGVGRELMRSAEEWARRRGCLEMGSDSLIDNQGSQRAHAALGFEVVDRCVNFRKTL
jgi:aminoglycoside 6'-N-acetyltransferase I